MPQSHAANLANNAMPDDGPRKLSNAEIIERLDKSGRRNLRVLRTQMRLADISLSTLAHTKPLLIYGAIPGSPAGPFIALGLAYAWARIKAAAGWDEEAARQVQAMKDGKTAPLKAEEFDRVELHRSVLPSPAGGANDKGPCLSLSNWRLKRSLAAFAFKRTIELGKGEWEALKAFSAQMVERVKEWRSRPNTEEADRAKAEKSASSPATNKEPDQSVRKPRDP